MDSPKRIVTDVPYIKTNTPKATKKLYWPKFSEENSPKMCGFAEKQEEFGWDDSPEPLKFDPKLITGHSKKRIDCLQSPVSSHPKKRIQRVMSPKLSQSADTDLAYMQELSRRILSTCSNTDIPQNKPSSSSSLLICRQATSEPTQNKPSNCNMTAPASCVVTHVPTPLVLTNVPENLASVPLPPLRPTAECARKECSPVQLTDSSFDSVLQSFFQAEEEDEWLSQLDVLTDKKHTPNKAKFSKSLSHNNLESPGRSSSFRRSTSFQYGGDTSRSRQEKNINQNSSFPKEVVKPTTVSQSENLPPESIMPHPLKKQKSFHVESQSQTVCSWEDIEKKRLEAKFRREFKEIERKKLEAQKRLNERRNRGLIKQ